MSTQELGVRSDGLLWAAGGVITDDHLAYSDHEASLEPVFRELLAAGGNRVFLDVGAHVGRWTLRLAGQARHVLAVEANPETAVALLTNLALNNIRNVSVLPFAAWDETCRMSLHDPNGKRRGGSTQVTPGNGEAVGLPLDSVIPPAEDICLVKLDVEGADLHALRGMATLLGTARPALFVECHDVLPSQPYKREELLAALDSLGYDVTSTVGYGIQTHLVCHHR